MKDLQVILCCTVRSFLTDIGGMIDGNVIRMGHVLHLIFLQTWTGGIGKRAEKGIYSRKSKLGRFGNTGVVRECERS